MLLPCCGASSVTSPDRTSLHQLSVSRDIYVIYMSSIRHIHVIYMSSIRHLHVISTSSLCLCGPAEARGASSQCFTHCSEQFEHEGNNCSAPARRSTPTFWIRNQNLTFSPLYQRSSAGICITHLCCPCLCLHVSCCCVGSLPQAAARGRSPPDYQPCRSARSLLGNYFILKCTLFGPTCFKMVHVAAAASHLSADYWQSVAG